MHSYKNLGGGASLTLSFYSIKRKCRKFFNEHPLIIPINKWATAYALREYFGLTFKQIGEVLACNAATASKIHDTALLMAQKKQKVKEIAKELRFYILYYK